MAVLEDAESAADFVEELRTVGFQKLLSGVYLVIDDRLEHRLQTFDDVLFGLASVV